jgi:hypothetical protein
MHQLLTLGGRKRRHGLFPDLVAHLGGLADEPVPGRGQLQQRRAAVARVHRAGQQALLFEGVDHHGQRLAGDPPATAAAFGAEGARVAITYHTNLTGAQATAERVEAAGSKALVVALDLEAPASIGASIGRVLEHWASLMSWSPTPSTGAPTGPTRPSASRTCP